MTTSPGAGGRRWNASLFIWRRLVRRGQEARHEVVRRGQEASADVVSRLEEELRSISERLARLEATLRKQDEED